MADDPKQLLVDENLEAELVAPKRPPPRAAHTRPVKFDSERAVFKPAFEKHKQPVRQST